MRGTFRLSRTGTDGVFVYFTVTNVNWLVSVGTGLHVTGSGTYKTGGAGHQQQMTLDLKVDDRPVEHYDSGLVSGGDYPRIDIELSVHGRYCLDTVFDVHARRLMTLAVGRTGLSWDPLEGATAYEVVGGDTQALRQSGGDFATSTSVCVASNESGTTASYDGAIPPGQATWFLGREIDGSSPGTYDSGDIGQVGSRDAGINTSLAGCP